MNASHPRAILSGAQTLTLTSPGREPQEFRTPNLITQQGKGSFAALGVRELRFFLDVSVDW